MNQDELHRSVVAELQRHSSGSPQSADQLYRSLGGESSTGLSNDSFRSFLKECNGDIHEVTAEAESVSPRYLAHPEVKRKQSHNNKRTGSQSSSRAGTPDSTLKRFNPRVNGLKSLFNAARKLRGNSRSGNISWNEIRNLYRKETSRHLNSEELNLICGTSNETKHDLLKNKLSSIFEMVDAKGLIVRLVSTSVPSQFSMEESECISAEAMEQKRKALAERLLRRGLVVSDGGRLSAAESGSSGSENFASLSSLASGDNADKINDSLMPHDEVFDDVQATASNSQRVEESQTKIMDNTESSSPTESDGKKNDIESSSPTASIECEDKSDAKFTSPVASDDLEESFSCNDQEAAVMFERSLLEHRNSIGSIDEEPMDCSSIQNSSEYDSDMNKAQISSVSSQMNAAFIANESQQISFASAAGCETSGEQGYTTSNDQLNSSSQMSDLDISINISNPVSSAMEPETPRVTHEITLCSSRNENDDSAAMPQPDVSPLTEDDGECEADVPSVRYRLQDSVAQAGGDPRPIEERVPHLSAPTLQRESLQKTEPLGEKVTAENYVESTKTDEITVHPINGDLVVASTSQESDIATITTVVTTISPAVVPLFSKRTESQSHPDTDEDDIPYDEESQKSDDDTTVGEIEMTTSSNEDSFTTVTVEVELHRKPEEFPCETSVSPTSQEKNEAMKVVGEFLKKMEIDHDGHSLSTIPEDRETIASLSPQKELEQRPMDIDVNSGETANQPDAILDDTESKKKKKERKVRIRMPRRRWFDCCSIL